MSATESPDDRPPERPRGWREWLMIVAGIIVMVGIAVGLAFWDAASR